MNFILHTMFLTEDILLALNEGLLSLVVARRETLPNPTITSPNNKLFDPPRRKRPL